jgi:hypothetical protein
VVGIGAAWAKTAVLFTGVDTNRIKVNLHIEEILRYAGTAKKV